MRHRGKEKTTDIPLPSPAIEVLALEATSRDLDIAGLIGQLLVSAINKEMIHERVASIAGMNIRLARAVFPFLLAISLAFALREIS